jgi:streptogramin lyase
MKRWAEASYERFSNQPVYTMTLRFALLLALFALCTESLAQDYVYVSSRGNHSVKRYSFETGDYVDDIIPANATRRTLTQEVLFGEDGMMYVSFRQGSESSAVHRYDPLTGEDLGAFTSGYALDQPTKMKWGPDGNLYISQWGNTRWNVAVFDGQSGEFLREATNEPSRLNLMDQAWDSNGNLLVVSFGSNSGGRDVRRYDSQGNYTGSLVSASSLVGPVNMWFETDGDLTVVDWGNQNGTGRIVRFDGTTGIQKQTLVSGLVHAEGAAIDDAGNLWIGDWGAHFVYRYDLETGAFVDRFIDSGGLLNPNSIAFGPPEAQSTEIEEDEQPRSFELRQNYPNPFNPRTNISFALSQSGRASLRVFDAMGREVARPIDNAFLPAGDHTASFDGAELPSGSYLYRLEVDGRNMSRTMALLK